MRGRLAAAALLGLLCACDVKLVDACDDSRTQNLTCVNLHLNGSLGQLDGFRLLVSGDWVGHSEPAAQDPFQLPAALAVALPPNFKGGVRIDVQAVRNLQVTGQGSITVLGLLANEHRTVDLTLTAPTGM